MGWWPINCIEHGGIDWDNKETELFMGDGPADIMGSVGLQNAETHTQAVKKMKSSLKKIMREYREEFNRKPYQEELIACFNFVEAPKIFMKDWKRLIKDFSKRGAK